MNKDELEYIKENFFQEKINLNLLMEMVGQVVSEDEKGEQTKFSAARFYNTALKSFNAPTEQAGKMGTSERQLFQKYITRNVRGTTLSEKINSINAIVDGAVQEATKISEIMGVLGAVKMLQQTLDDFNESTAGFLFEAFLSGLLQGTQVTDRVGGSLPIEDCMFFVDPKTGDAGQPVSLKLLSPKTRIEGSIPNLLAFFQRPEIAAVAEERGIEYIVATKTVKNELDVYSFNIKPSNFFYWVEERYFDLHSHGTQTLEERLITESSPEQIEEAKNVWENAFLQRAAMFGLDSSEVQFNYEWRTASRDWRRVVSPPSSSTSTKRAKENVLKVAEIILSDNAKKRFARWKSSELNVPSNVHRLDTLASFEGKTVDLEEEFRSGDPERSLAAAKQLALLGKARLIAYFDSIEHVGERVREFAGHIQRWWALNKRGEQHVESDVVAKIQSLLQAGTPEATIEWAKTLEELRYKNETQFDIHPVRVRSEGTLYGTINVNKKKIYRTLQRYSNQLAELCAPIYEDLEKLSGFINGYFLQNRVGDAFRAQEAASSLSQHTDKLAEKAEK
tara:strand:- start:5612 stop:7300 length:1689 start_codon:yes stop_codon:yes gene_type:complete